MRNCYGRDWEDMHPDCRDCSDEYTCRDRTLRQRRLGGQRNTPTSSASSGGRESYSYITNKDYLFPRPGESPLSRILKNMLSGMISSAGGEVYCFWQNWRLPPDQPLLDTIPHEPTAPTSRPPSTGTPPKSTVPGRNPAKTKPLRVEKKTIRVSDDLDDYDDLDDL